MLAAEKLDKRIQIAVKTLATNFIMNFVTQHAPFFHGSFYPTAFDGFHGAVHSHPGHHFGMGEMSPRSTNFPNAIIRLFPGSFEMFQQYQADPRAVALTGNQSGLAAQIKACQ